MIIQHDSIIKNLPHAIPTGLPVKEIAFLDLETKAYGRKNSSIQYLGLLFMENDGWIAQQWIAETSEDEPIMLREFLSLLSSFSLLVHYNGTSFDLPFLAKRCLRYELSFDSEAFQSLDLYRCFAPLKKLLQLPSLSQRTLEAFLDLPRQGLQDNDLTMLPRLLPLFSYLELLQGKFTVLDTELKKDSLIATARLHNAVPNPFSLPFAYGYLSAKETELRILIYGIQDTLKYFYPDYKNYYYLPKEDTAIHKSVAEYVDKEHRVPARAATCYQKKSGFFLPLAKPDLQPFFSKNYKDGQWYLMCDEKFLSDPARIYTYLLNCLQGI